MLRRVLRSLVVLVALLAGAVLALALVVIEGEPLVRTRAAPTPEDVVTARGFVSDVKTAASTGTGRASPLVTDQAELTSVVRLGVRLIPGFRGQITVEPWGVDLRASVPIALPGATRWLNLAVTVPQFEKRVTLERVVLGPLTIPPGIALQAGRIGANMILGDGLGDTAVSAASGMRVADNTVAIDLEIGRVGENGIIGGLFGALRGGKMPPRTLVDNYHVRIREAMDRGDLPIRGSFLPYLVFTLNAAQEGARTEGASDAFTAAIFALTRICGAHDFHLLFGDVVKAGTVAARDWQTECTRLKLNNRIDSRRHFITAAAIQAASNRNVSVTVGEYKELRDTVRSGGFDFTDLAANNSGVRLADLFMTTPPERWPELIARIEAEGDVIVPYDDIPQILTRAEFSGRFGEIDSPAYLEMIELIEARIDTLALHAPL
ncbi:hypothetical protein [Roseovarius sp. D22-M7]|uniref:hypothetical protein n=1 Tax=Roseovarius sp. D22-M7 TaxID=3127116 RepID=UPI00300FD1A2